MMFFGRKNILLLLLCFLIIAFMLGFSSVTFSLDVDMDLKVILSGIQYYDSLIKSGEGEVIYKRVQTPGLADDGHRITCEYYLIFNQRQTRMDIPERFSGNIHHPKLTFVDTGSEGEWHLPDNKQGIPRPAYYTASTNTFTDWHPKLIMTQWETGNVYGHLKEKNFRIKQKQKLKQGTCYVLENTEGEKMWIAPEQGFRLLQYEHRFALRINLPRRGLKEGTPMLERKEASYQKYGEVWFPKQILFQTFAINQEGQKQLLSMTQIEMKHFEVNHSISKETFTVDIPENSQIWVGDLRKRLSKKEFLNLYDSEWVK